MCNLYHIANVMAAHEIMMHEPGHQQQWHWPSLPRILCPQYPDDGWYMCWVWDKNIIDELVGCVVFFHMIFLYFRWVNLLSSQRQKTGRWITNPFSLCQLQGLDYSEMLVKICVSWQGCYNMAADWLAALLPANQKPGYIIILNHHGYYHGNSAVIQTPERVKCFLVHMAFIW